MPSSVLRAPVPAGSGRRSVRAGLRTRSGLRGLAGPPGFSRPRSPAGRWVGSVLVVAVLGLAACGGRSGAPSPVAASAPVGTPAAAASPTPIAVPTVGTATGDHGTYLVDKAGKALYLYTKDTGTASVCKGGCLQAWPALLTPDGTFAVSGGANSALIGVTVRDDRTKQLTYNGHPLYYYVQDIVAGDVTGQAVGAVWYLVSPAGAKITS